MADTYTVQRGDTLSALGNVKELMKLNPAIKDPNKIYIGQVITLPETGISPLTTTAPAEVPQTPTSAADSNPADKTVPSPAPISPRQQLLQQLFDAEDFRENAYPDPAHGYKKPTIGYGTTEVSPGALNYLKSQGLDPSKVFTIGKGGQAITETQAKALANLALDFNKQELQKIYPNFDNYPEPARIGLQEMAYQMGPTGVANFPNMSAALRADEVDWDTVANEGLDSQWGRRYNTRARRVTDQIRSSGTWKPPVLYNNTVPATTAATLPGPTVLKEPAAP